MMAEATGYWLTKLRLHDWQVLRNQELQLPIGRGLHLEGDIGAGKTTILDAIQWALVGDEIRVRFNAAAGEARSKRDLRSYVRCYDQTQSDYLRVAGQAHVLLEFTHLPNREQVTVGVFVRYDEDGDLTKTFIIADVPLTLDWLTRPSTQGGREWLPVADLRRHQKRQEQRNVYFRLFDTAQEYREKLCERFGDLDPRFFEVFTQSLMGNEPKNLDAFIRGLLFTEKPIDVSDLRARVVELREAEKRLAETRIQLKELDGISAIYASWRNAIARAESYRLCQLKLRADMLNETLAQFTDQLNTLAQKQERLREQIALAETAQAEADKADKYAIQQQQSNAIEQELQELAGKIQSEETKTNKLCADLEQSQRVQRELVALLEVAHHALEALQAFTPAEMWEVLAHLKQIVSAAPSAAEVADALSRLSAELGKVQLKLQDELQRTEDTAQRIERSLRENQPTPDNLVERALRIRQRLEKEHGRVHLLYEVVDSVEERWQGVVEQMLGVRRFTLIPAQEHWANCQVTFRQLPPEEVERIHLIQPNVALKYNHPARLRSLAHQVNSTNPLARGLVNLHLEKYEAEENEERAVQVEAPTVTINGLVVTGGTIERRRPLERRNWVLGEVARQHARAEMQAELVELRHKEKQWRTLLDDARRLSQNVRQLAQSALRLNPQLSAEIEALAHTLKQYRFRQTELMSTPNYLALAERAAQARQKLQDAISATSTLKNELVVCESDATRLAPEVAAKRREIEEVIRQLSATAQSDWETAYWPLKMESVSLTEGHEKAGQLTTQYQAASKEDYARLDERVHRYVDENFPTLMLAPIDEKIQACLSLREQIVGLKLNELTERVHRFRVDSENILFRSFLDQLLKEHKLIENTMRQLNRTLEKVTFARRQYTLRKETVATGLMRETLDFMTEYAKRQADYAGLDLTDQLRHTHADIISRLFQVLAPQGTTSPEEQSLGRALATPVNYFYFDLKVVEGENAHFDLSRSFGMGSGGERQVPIYIVLIAAMLRFYRSETGQLDPRRWRLILMDEAFNKAPMHSRTGLGLVLEHGLQPIVATPIGRPEVEEVIGNTLHIYRDESGARMYIVDRKPTE